MLVTDGRGIPLGGLIESAQVSEYKLALPTLETIAVNKRAYHTRKRAEAVCADRGYDAKWLRQALRKKLMKPYIPYRRRRGQEEEPVQNERIKPVYKTRWIVERTFAWLGWNRKLLVRFERYPARDCQVFCVNGN